jgi:predicted N-acetyltransferase YhbS
VIFTNLDDLNLQHCLAVFLHCWLDYYAAFGFA